MSRSPIAVAVACLICSLAPVRAQGPPADRQTLEAEHDAAIRAVQAIVNAPVTVLPRPPTGWIPVFTPGWFHEGAVKPDFEHVDVRTTQEFPYAKYEHVSSSLNPGVMFVAAQLEFNSMTKFFYTDRSLPKKRLSEPEMLEINRLYRVIARCERELAPPAPATRVVAPAPATTATAPAPRSASWVPGPLPITLGVAVLLLGSYAWRRHTSA